MSVTDEQTAVQLLTNGDLVVIPTETVYGLAADATNPSAVEKIFSLKGRPATNPLICHVATLDQLYGLVDPEKLAAVKPDIEKLAHFWPGALTVIVPKASPLIPDIVTAGTNTVAVRIPNHPLALSLLKKLPFPLAAPSANRSNYISPTSAEHVAAEFKDEAPFILNGGDCEIGLESTVLSLIDFKQPIVVRAGAITKEALTQALGKVVIDSRQVISEIQARTAPGQMPIHYAPNTPLRLLSTFDLSSTYLTRIGLVAFDAAVAKDYDFAAIEILSENRNLRSVAHRLYGALRKLDTFDLELILIDECSPIGIGAAVMDRINRAIKK